MPSTRLHFLLPPQLFILITLMMFIVAIVDEGTLRLARMPWTVLGAAVVIGGAVLCVSNARRFGREEANIVTFADPTALIADGWFAHTRNPMYLGFLMVLIGIAVLLAAWPTWVGPALFFAAAQWWYIPFEERRMEAQFGDAYREYAHRVRRWI